MSQSHIHFKVLNQSRGPAVQGPRAQADRGLYKKEIQSHLYNIDKLVVYEGTVVKFDISKKTFYCMFVKHI